MDYTRSEIEHMVRGLNRVSFEPPTTPEEQEDRLLVAIRRIIKMADGLPDQLEARFSAEGKSLFYDGREFARYCKEVENDGLWFEFHMYPALRAKYGHDSRFAEVANKGSDYWRVVLPRPQDIEAYADVIVDETL